MCRRATVDFRKGHDGLTAMVQSVLRKDPFTGTVFAFRAKRADRLKLLYWDGTGLVMAYKRLEKTAFIHRYWGGLQTFLTDGRVEIDSNNVENLVHPIALNLKNALFAGHDEGGHPKDRIDDLLPWNFKPSS